MPGAREEVQGPPAAGTERLTPRSAGGAPASAPVYERRFGNPGLEFRVYAVRLVAHRRNRVNAELQTRSLATQGTFETGSETGAPGGRIGKRKSPQKRGLFAA
ncbi:hypothetical protein LBMAG56_24710 [Verrucomicrobiota bacterium]|nr:hypothetical protein LBMAG56_24710 [Verrucomicrobiota bacterium]